MDLQITATSPEQPATLLDLPWNVPLEEWPEEYLVALPRGISRHVVRFALAGDEVVAVKEVGEWAAVREYGLLRDLDRMGIPAVDPLAVVTGRTDDRGEPLEPVLITRHLGGSQPYRSMFETTMRPGTVNRLLDALAVLLVRLHIREQPGGCGGRLLQGRLAYDVLVVPGALTGGENAGVLSGVAKEQRGSGVPSGHDSTRSRWRWTSRYHAKVPWARAAARTRCSATAGGAVRASDASTPSGASSRGSHSPKGERACP